MMVSVRISSGDEFHPLGESFLPPTLVLAFAVIGHEVPIRLVFGKVVRESNGRVPGLLAVAEPSQCLGKFRVGRPYLVQVERNPIVEKGILYKGSLWPGMCHIAGTGFAEDAEGHGVAEDAVHAVLWKAKLCGDVGERHLALERNQLRDPEFGDDLQCRKIVLDLDSSSMSFLFACETVQMSYPIGECCDAVYRSKRQVSDCLSSFNQRHSGGLDFFEFFPMRGTGRCIGRKGRGRQVRLFQKLAQGGCMGIDLSCETVEGSHDEATRLGR